MFCCAGADDDVAASESKGAKFAKIEIKGWKVDPNPIGEGGFGAVHLCTEVKTGKRRACKAMRLPTAQDRDDFRHEAAVLKATGKHKNICHCIDVAEDARYGYLVMQSCTGGELFDRIAARNCSEKDAAMAIVDVLAALNHLHTKRIIHRDIKPENLLYKDKQPGSPLKLIDFGLAIQLQPGQRETEVCGTTSYMAPEVLRGSYSFECDIWSLGVICFFMLSGKLPFPGRSDEEKEARILRGSFSFSEKQWNSISDEAKDFIKRILSADESKRMSGRKALLHPWVTNRAKYADKFVPKEVAESVKRYAQAHRFQKAVRHSMATNLTSSELHKLRNIFEGLDTEGHGTITIARLKEVLEAEAAETGQNPFGGIDLSNFDIDGDGEIDWQEFVAAIMDDHELHNEENLAKVFRQLDVDSSGTLSLTEISTILGNEHQFSRQVLEAVKRNRGTGDGVETIQMTFDEFKNLMLSKGDLSAVSKKRRRDTIKNFSISEVQTDENAEQNV